MPFIQNKLVDQFIDHESSSFLGWKIVWVLHVRMSHELFTFDMNTSSDQLYRLPFLHRWISEPHWISFVLINYAENELLNFGKWKNFMFDQWLAICWDIIEIPATVHFSKITQMFATLRNWSICISVNEWNLNSIRICCYFGLHFGWWTKLLNLAQEFFHLFPKLSKRRSCDREFQNK